MKKSINSMLQPVVVTLAVSLIVIGCQEEEMEGAPSAQFVAGVQSVPEGGETTIGLELDKVATENGSINITIESNGILDEHFFTDLPFSNGSFVLNVNEGQTSAEFKVTAIDNNTFDNGKYMIFTLTKPTKGLKLGKLTSVTVTIADDEGPSLANFAVHEGTVSESDPLGIAIQIALTTPAKEEGIVTVVLHPSSAVYGTNFTTSPAAANDSIIFNIKKNDVSVTFNVIPIDNELLDGDFIKVFSISAAAGGVQKGNALNYLLTIKDDEGPSVASFEIAERVTPECDYYTYECAPSYSLGRGSIKENHSSGMVVPILFSGPASGTGTIMILLPDTGYGTRFTTVPAPSAAGTLVIPVASGEVSPGFTIFPIDDDLYRELPDLLFEITSTTGVVNKGECLKYILTITEDEIPSIANFQPNAGVAIGEEDAAGLVVEIPFSEPTHGPGSVTVRAEGYGQYFTTVPPPSAGSDITWNVAQNATGVSFKIIPIDNFSCGSKFSASFHLSSGGFIKTGDRSFYQVPITDNEASIVRFDVNQGTVDENNTSGKVITLNFSKPAPENSTMYFTLGECNGRLITSPAAVCYDDYYGSYTLLTLAVPKDAVSAQFTVIPVNDNIHGEYMVNIYPWVDTHNCLQIPSNSQYKLIIVDDD